MELLYSFYEDINVSGVEMMKHLAEYVAVIDQVNSQGHSQIDDSSHHLYIIHQTQTHEYQQEQDIQVLKEKIVYEFSDGTIIEKRVEQDNECIEIEACLESWINYQVLYHSNELVTPQRIHFDNHCREIHWIKYFHPANN